MAIWGRARRALVAIPLRALRIVRPANALTASAAVIIAAYLAGGAAWPAWVAGALAAFTFACAGNVRNDMMDVGIDRHAHPERPLVTGELSIQQARSLVIILYGAALASAYTISSLAFGVVAVALALMETYERRLKLRGLPGNIAVGVLTAAPFIVGGLAANHLGPIIWSVAGLAALATVGREILKDVEDSTSDAAHRRTLPHRIGARAASGVAALFLAAAMVLSPLPWVLETVLGAAYLPAVAAADACFGTAAVMGFARPEKGQRLAKAGMLLALLALVIGRVQGGVVN